MLSDPGMREVAELLRRYPRKQAAMVPLFYLVMREQGFVSAEAEEWIAELLEVPPVKVHEALTFYTMTHQQPVGRYHLQVCRTLSCHLRGAQRLLARLREAHDLSDGQVAPDGLFSLEEVECLGACGNAPVMQVNEDMHHDLTVEKLEELVARLQAEARGDAPGPPAGDGSPQSGEGA